MTVRSYRFSFEAEPIPGVPDFTDEEKLEMSQGLLDFMESLPPERRMQAFLVNGPLLRLDERLVENVLALLPSAEVHLDGVRVAVEAAPR